MTEKHIEDSAAPLMEHLIELRSRLIKCVLAFVVAMMVCFAVADPIYAFLSEPLREALLAKSHDPTMIITAPQEIFFVYISVSMFGGFVVAFPYIAFQLWRFVAPGLYKSEQNAFLPFLIASPVLFLTGAAFAYYAAMPLALDFFLSFEKLPDAASTDLAIKATIKANEYLGLTMKFIIAFGIAFQLPVALTLMAKAGLVGSDWLKENRKYAIVGLLLAAAIVTPPDAFSMMLMFSVIYSLYEISVFLVVIVEKKREEKLRAEGYYDDEDEEDDEGAGDVGDAPDEATEEDPLLKESETWDDDGKEKGP